MNTPESGPVLDSLTARNVMRSLYSGVVPDVGYRAFSHGRDRWLKSLAVDIDDLASEQSTTGRLRIVNGRNGDGKTHLMHLLSELAASHGFAVAYIVVSEHVPLHKWDRIYGEIARTIRTPSGVTGLHRILDPRAPAPEIETTFNSRSAAVREVAGLDPNFATAVYRYTTQQTVNVDAAQDMHLLGAWLEGYEHLSTAMRPFGIGAGINPANGAAILRSLVRTLRHFGIPGVLFMIDEVESILALSKPRRRDGYQSLRLLVDGTGMAAHALTVASTTPPMYTDLERGLMTYPALWSRLRIDDSATTVNYYGTTIDLTKTPLQVEDYIRIAESICAINTAAWGTGDLWPIISDRVAVAAEMAASGRLAMTFSATRVFVKLIADMLRAVTDLGLVPPAYDNMGPVFGTTDDQLVAGSSAR